MGLGNGRPQSDCQSVVICVGAPRPGAAPPAAILFMSCSRVARRGAASDAEQVLFG